MLRSVEQETITTTNEYVYEIRNNEIIPKYFPLKSNDMHWTALVCPLRVLSNSPDSKSHILIVESSEEEARMENTGWNDIEDIGERCPLRQNLSGDLGIPSDADDDFFDGAELNSSWAVANFDSKSMTWAINGGRKRF